MAVDHRLKKIEFLLPRALARDRHAARREIKRLSRAGASKHAGGGMQPRLLRLEKRLAASVQKRAWRLANRPALKYNESLPIFARKDDIITAISRYPVIIISGETGSGKTTQIPKFCLAAGRGIDGIVGCTQPRRIAAIAVANRIAEELGQKPGQAVGYKIRFSDRTRPDGFIKIMTDGILLAEAQRDRLLSAYDTIIVDEAHERSLNIDFILGMLQSLRVQRSDLKLIITSATLDTEKFSAAFDNAPVIEVSGRTYPVDVRYFTPEAAAEKNGELTHVELAVQAAVQLQKETRRGDILIFMPTEQDIRETCELLEAAGSGEAFILPLFARLTAAEQRRVFKPLPGRKIIVATNVAETSLTIPGIKYVIDSGLARISRYSPRSRTTSLPVRPVSRSSADQRKGRCGRVENGVCIRLYDEADYASRPLFTPPEILRANLAEVILRMIALKLGNIADFPFIDRPDAKSIQDGFNLLFELGAIAQRQKVKGKRLKAKKIVAGVLNAEGGITQVRLTDKGRLMARIPVDPRLGRMLIEARQEGCLEEIVVIAAALSIQDPRERPVEKAAEADDRHAAFNDPASDFITLLNIWRRYHGHLARAKSNHQMKRFCRENFLSFKRMREWRDIHGQISAILAEHGLALEKKGPPAAASAGRPISDSRYRKLHTAILSGFLSNIAQGKEKNIYRAARGREVMIFPGSGLFNRAGSWIVAAEMVQTSRLFARTLANIDADWLEDLGAALCRRTYLDPHWEKNRGEVVASEQVSLFGLIIVAARPVAYSRIDPQAAAEIFIRSALVAGDLKKPPAFIQHNQQLVDSVRDLEHRLRRRDILVSEEQMAAFYTARLKGVYDLRSLAKYLQQKGDDRFLRMKEEDLCLYQPEAAELGLYPDRVALGRHRFECSYRLEPDGDRDGVTVHVPAALAAEVPPESTDWLVPGLLREKIAALIRGLPKIYRKKLVPVRDAIAVICREMPQSGGNLITGLGTFIFERFGLDIPASAWRTEMLPDHLKMRIAITDGNGRELCADRDPAILRRPGAGGPRSTALEAIRRRWEKNGLTRWDCGDLPDFISSTGTQTAAWIAYPALVASAPAGSAVALRLFDRQNEAVAAHKKGVAALFALHFARDLKFLKRSLALPADLVPAATDFGGSRCLEEKMCQRVIRRLFARNIRSADAFYTHARATAPEIIPAGRQLLDKVRPVLSAYHETRQEISKLQAANRNSSKLAEFFQELSAQLTRLMPPSFLELYDAQRLDHLPRYIRAIGIRARRALVDPEKDRVKARAVSRFTAALDRLLKGLSPAASVEKRRAIEDFHWMIEEYRVSVFAQEIKTAQPVSQKRLAQQLQRIERMG